MSVAEGGDDEHELEQVSVLAAYEECCSQYIELLESDELTEAEADSGHDTLRDVFDEINLCASSMGMGNISHANTGIGKSSFDTIEEKDAIDYSAASVAGYYGDDMDWDDGNDTGVAVFNQNSSKDLDPKREELSAPIVIHSLPRRWMNNVDSSRVNETSYAYSNLLKLGLRSGPSASVFFVCMERYVNVKSDSYRSTWSLPGVCTRSFSGGSAELSAFNPTTWPEIVTIISTIRPNDEGLTTEDISSVVCSCEAFQVVSSKYADGCECSCIHSDFVRNNMDLAAVGDLAGSDVGSNSRFKGVDFQVCIDSTGDSSTISDGTGDGRSPVCPMDVVSESHALPPLPSIDVDRNDVNNFYYGGETRMARILPGSVGQEECEVGLIPISRPGRESFFLYRCGRVVSVVKQTMQKTGNPTLTCGGGHSGYCCCKSSVKQYVSVVVEAPRVDQGGVGGGVGEVGVKTAPPCSWTEYFELVKDTELPDDWHTLNRLHYLRSVAVDLAHKENDPRKNMAVARLNCLSETGDIACIAPPVLPRDATCQCGLPAVSCDHRGWS